MTLLVVGQILGVSFACGLNLYLTVAALGILSRFEVIQTLPPGLQGLEGLIVIGSAATLYLVETVIDKVGHADSLWDTVHTFIRPPAAAFIAVGTLWGQTAEIMATGAALGFLVAITAHGTKAGIRMALNAARSGGHVWVSVSEDLLAVAFAITAFLDPMTALISTCVILGLVLLLGPRYWRAFRLGLRALGAWLRTLFRPAGWREGDRIPARVRARLDPTPLGAAPPRGARGALHGLPGVGAYRNGWLVITTGGPVFVYRTLLGHRKVDLPAPLTVRLEPGPWTDVITIEAGDDAVYRLYMLKDGPPLDMTTPHLQQAAP